MFRNIFGHIFPPGLVRTLQSSRFGTRPFLYIPSNKSFMTTTKGLTNTAADAFASIDLSGYDQTQSKLMDERCIVVDESDKAIGALDKKTCGS